MGCLPERLESLIKDVLTFLTLNCEDLSKKDFLFTCVPQTCVISVSSVMKDGFKSTTVVLKSKRSG